MSMLDPLPSSLDNNNESEKANSLGLTDRAYKDLKRSGLSDEYIKLMRVHNALGTKEEEADDYVIPYFDSSGKIIPHFNRTRIFRDNNTFTNGKKKPKYLQSFGEPNHLYFPPNWNELRFGDYLIITEGEKKAASAAQYGIPIIALGGVDSWTTTTMEFGVDVDCQVKRGDMNPETGKQDPARILLKLDDKVVGTIKNKKLIAPELEKIIKEVARRDKPIYVIYDTDKLEDGRLGIKDQVIESAHRLLSWVLLMEDVNVKMVKLPALDDKKTGLDDFLAHPEGGVEKFKEILRNVDEHFYPVPEFPKQWVTEVLDGKTGRAELRAITQMIMGDLDAKGKRFKSDETNEYFYFYNATNTLMTVNANLKDLNDIIQSEFGELLYTLYGLKRDDNSVLSSVQTMFCIGRGIERDFTPYKWSKADDNALYYQMNDSQMIMVNADEVSIRDNGYNGIYFRSGVVRQEIDITDEDIKAHGEHDNKWLSTLQTANIKAMKGITKEQTQIILSCHFYLSPWFRRWRNMMLPLEITVAEPASGKSLLYTLRKFILTGENNLNRLPQDMKDWHADIVNTAGFWVGDNIGKMPNQLLHQFSDELARLITDLRPEVTMRKLYTTNENGRFPVQSVFAVTSINNPFTNEDIIQRSIVINMEAIPMGLRNSRWLEDQLELNGGRKGWILNQLFVAKAFFGIVQKEWKNNYGAHIRLINYEQALLRMGVALGYEESTMYEIITGFVKHTQQTISEDNPVIAGLVAFADEHRHKAANTKSDGFVFTVQDIVDWALLSDEYSDVDVLCNTRKLGKYITGHAYDIKASSGIAVYDNYGNKNRFKIGE